MLLYYILSDISHTPIFYGFKAIYSGDENVTPRRCCVTPPLILNDFTPTYSRHVLFRLSRTPDDTRYTYKINSARTYDVSSSDVQGFKTMVINPRIGRRPRSDRYRVGRYYRPRLLYTLPKDPPPYQRGFIQGVLCADTHPIAVNLSQSNNDDDHHHDDKLDNKSCWSRLRFSMYIQLNPPKLLSYFVAL